MIPPKPKPPEMQTRHEGHGIVPSPGNIPPIGTECRCYNCRRHYPEFRPAKKIVYRVTIEEEQGHEAIRPGSKITV